MTKKKSQQALTIGNVSWASKTPLCQDELDTLEKYLRRFVYESESIGSSNATNGFIKDFKIDRTQRASKFMTYMRLRDDPTLRFRYCNSPSELAEYLRTDQLDTDSFIYGQSEFVYITFSCPTLLSKAVNDLREFRKKPAKNVPSGKRNKSEFYRLDAVMRHLRNAFAHGQCRCITSPDGTPYWALQDANGHKRVTARMLLKQSTLDSWVDLFCQRDIRYR